MATIDIARSGVDKVLDKFGGSFSYWTATNTYNIYGDKTSTWTGPNTFTAAMAPADKTQIKELREYGKPVTSTVNLVCEPTVGPDSGDKVSIFNDDFEVTDVSHVAVGGTKIYKRVVTNKIEHT